MLSETTHCANSAPPLTKPTLSEVNVAEESLSLFPLVGKHCSACGQEKPLSEFYIDKRSGRHNGQCKKCRYKKTRAYQVANPEKAKVWVNRYRAANFGKIRARTWRYRKNNPDKVRESAKLKSRAQKLRRMGVTAEQVLAQYQSQNGLCAICQVTKVFLWKKGTHLDHCHKTMKFRGILCLKCNTGLGKFDDDPPRMIRASKYLRGEVIKV